MEALRRSEATASAERQRRRLTDVHDYDPRTGIGGSLARAAVGHVGWADDLPPGRFDKDRGSTAESMELGQLLARTAAQRARKDRAPLKWDVAAMMNSRDSNKSPARAAGKNKPEDQRDVDSDEDSVVFQGAPVPGSRFLSGLRTIATQLGSRGGSQFDIVVPRVTTWLNSIFLGAVTPEKMSRRNLTELRFLAAAIDHLTVGDLAHLGDLLMQRLKAVQTAATEGDWSTASELDVTPLSSVLLTSEEEQRAAARAKLLKVRLAEAKAKLGGVHDD